MALPHIMRSCYHSEPGRPKVTGVTMNTATNSVQVGEKAKTAVGQVAPKHRYSLAQIRYHYGQSLETIQKYMKAGDK